MNNYNDNRYSDEGNTVLLHRIINTELDFDLVYDLIKRRNEDEELDAETVYDIVITKRGRLTPPEKCVLCAVSSLLRNARQYYYKLLNNAVTPMCAMEIFCELI